MGQHAPAVPPGSRTGVPDPRARCLQLRVNQEEPGDEETPRPGEREAQGGGFETQSSSKDQMRTNVINEILSTERDYIKHLRDICEVRGGGQGDRGARRAWGGGTC